MTRVWFAISINGADAGKLKDSVVTEVKELVKGEIWKVTVAIKPSRNAKSERETFYVLELTCEVIGLPPAPADPLSTAGTSGTSDTRNGTKLRLRADWSNYVEYRISCNKGSDDRKPILSHLKTSNTEEYMNGISKLWMTRASKEAEIGDCKITIAERYVLACVMGNR